MNRNNGTSRGIVFDIQIGTVSIMMLRSMIVNHKNSFRILPLPDVSIYLINQQNLEMHNLRVCYRSLEVVAVVPFPVDDSPWADPALCLNAK